MKKNALFLPLLLCALCILSCGKRSESFTLCAWNLQAFFDGVEDGVEFAEFTKKAFYTERVYLERVKRLSKFIERTDADIYAFEEMERSESLEDLCRFLGNKKWKYAAFVRSPSSPFGCALLSRFPIENVRSHAFDFRNSGKFYSLRPVLEAELSPFGKKTVIFVNHWKSKRGGKKSESARSFQSSAVYELCRLRREAGFCVVSCGDFNRGAADFVKDGTFHDFAPSFQLAEGEGTHFYSGKWSLIDHIFLGGAAKFESFMILKSGNLTRLDGTPNRFYMDEKEGKGYSDHLPVYAKILLTE